MSFDISMSLDGYIAAPNGRPEEPLGDKGEGLHDWAFSDYAVRMNTIPKHVASRTLTEVKWNATLLGDDVVDAVRKLKEQPGGDILKVGTGERLYDGIDSMDFDLIDVKRLDNGILGLTYVPTTRRTWKARVTDIGPASPSRSRIVRKSTSGPSMPPVTFHGR